MSETWSNASSTSETWTTVTAGSNNGVFSQLVFSRVYHTNGDFVFSFKSSDGNSEGWGITNSSAESWTNA